MHSLSKQLRRASPDVPLVNCAMFSGSTPPRFHTLVLPWWRRMFAWVQSSSFVVLWPSRQARDVYVIQESTQLGLNEA